MTHVFQARAELVQMVPVDQLLARLQGLRQRHMDAGRVGHARGVQSAINQVQADLRKRPTKPGGPTSQE